MRYSLPVSFEFITPANKYAGVGKILSDRHPGERRGPETARKDWIPAFAGMTGKMNFGDFFTSSSNVLIDLPPTPAGPCRWQ
jgi:hypothetical protein